jgi:hypothetical protein
MWHKIDISKAVTGGSSENVGVSSEKAGGCNNRIFGIIGFFKMLDMTRVNKSF